LQQQRQHDADADGGRYRQEQGGDERRRQLSRCLLAAARRSTGAPFWFWSAARR
jgi:hypothetical protein